MTTAYLILKYLHVLLAIAAVGANITYGIWLTRTARQSAHLEHVLRGIKFLDDRVANPAFVLLLATGVAMVYVGRIPWTTPWILTSIMLYVLLAAGGLLGYSGQLRRQIAALAGGSDSLQYRAAAGRAQLTGILLMIIMLAIVFLMVTKPALWG